MSSGLAQGASILAASPVVGLSIHAGLGDGGITFGDGLYVGAPSAVWPYLFVIFVGWAWIRLRPRTNGWTNGWVRVFWMSLAINVGSLAAYGAVLQRLHQWQSELVRAAFDECMIRSSGPCFGGLIIDPPPPADYWQIALAAYSVMVTVAHILLYRLVERLVDEAHAHE